MSIFSAADPALGYLYQIRLALLLALRRSRGTTSFQVSVEVLDDIAFETDGAPPELLQTKHRVRSNASLSDASPDLWKTIRVWAESLSAGTIDTDASLYLVTTSVASPGSAAEFLTARRRDVDSALALLLETARTSSNKESAAAYLAFQSLKSPVQRSLISAIQVLDGSKTIVDLNDELLAEVAGACARRHRPSLLERLEGWWLQRVINHLAVKPSDRIHRDELDLKLDELREQYSRESLPIDSDIAEVRADDPRLLVHKGSPFVVQLNLVVPRSRRVLLAIQDYYRAYTQRSRWVREHLLLVPELERYERVLTEAWELYFEARRAELGSNATEERMKQIASRVLEWAEACTIPIRPKISETFVARGSLHILADELRVGWHPEFRSRLASLLRPPAVGAG